MMTPMVTMTAMTSWVGEGSAVPKTMQERADRQGEHATAPDAEGEIAQLEERAGLHATIRHTVGAAQGKCEDERDGEQRVNPDVRQQLSTRSPVPRRRARGGSRRGGARCRRRRSRRRSA